MIYIKKKEVLAGLDICKGVKMSNKDDLLNIGNGKNQNNMKKILIYVAAAFLVFVIGVIGFAVVQNNKNSEKNTIIPPSETKPQPKQDNLFKQIPIENENEQKQPQQKQSPKPQNIKKEVIQNSTKNPSQNETENEAKNKPEIQKEVKPATPSKAKVEKPAVKKVIKPKKPQRTIHKAHKKVVNKGKYYIQVAALLRHKKPSKKFLQLITKAGYKYKFFVTYTKLKGEKVKVTKVLVGPFSNRLEAKKALKKVKENITQNAFIFKVK